MVVLNRIAVLLVLAGAILFGVREGADDAVNGHPEALWQAGVDQADDVITENTREDVSTTLDYVTNVTD